MEASSRYSAAFLRFLKKKSTHVTVTTFNLCSHQLYLKNHHIAISSYASQNHKEDDEALKLLYLRVENHKQTLHFYVTKLRSILCLQEVDDAQLEAGLDAFFKRESYMVVKETCQKNNNNNSNSKLHFNAIAFPTELFTVDMSLSGIERIGEQVVLEEEHEDNDRAKKGEVAAAADEKEMIMMRLKNPFRAAKRKQSAFLWVNLTCVKTGLCFNVFNCHVPVAFAWPALGTVMMDNLQKRIKSITGTAPCVLGGDFNVFQDSVLYNMLTTGQLSCRKKVFHPCPDWQDEKHQPLRKVFRDTSRQAKPYFPTTRCLQNNNNNKVFSGKIDFVMHDRESNWLLLQTWQQDIRDPRILLPSYQNPETGEGFNLFSDHIPFCAVLQLCVSD